MSWFNRNRRGVKQTHDIHLSVPPEGKKLTAESQLLWNEEVAPLLAALQHTQSVVSATVQRVGTGILTREGYSPDGYVLNIDSMAIERKPNDKMGERGQVASADQGGG